MTYAKLTVPQLKDKLKERNLPLSGVKKELIERLEQSDSGRQEAPGDDERKGEAKEIGGQPQDGDGTDDNDLTAKVTERVRRFGGGGMSADDMRKLREKRFNTGDPIGDEDRKRARAERFGIETDDVRKAKALERAKRFNVQTPEIVAEKLAARKARFVRDKVTVAASKDAEPEPANVEELAALIKKR